MKAENSKKHKSKMGGARPGGGRPKGSKDKKKQKPTIKTKKTKAKKAKTKKPVKSEVPYPRYRPAPDVTTPYPEVGDEVDKYGPRDAEFERKLAGHIREPQPAKPKPTTPDVTEQSEFEIKIIADFLKLPFALWASRINFPAMRLTETEAREWAEPTKVLLDHYMPKIPTMAYAWIAWSITTTSIMSARFELIHAEKRKRGSEAQPKVTPGPAPVQGAKAHKPVSV